MLARKCKFIPLEQKSKKKNLHVLNWAIKEERKRRDFPTKRTLQNSFPVRALQAAGLIDESTCRGRTSPGRAAQTLLLSHHPSGSSSAANEAPWASTKNILLVKDFKAARRTFSLEKSSREKVPNHLCCKSSQLMLSRLSPSHEIQMSMHTIFSELILPTGK